jgi:hypothetical protein
MKSSLLIAAALLVTVAGYSQKAVLLHKTNGTQQAFYSSQPLADAYNAASNGDTIYVPGGTFNGLSCDKRIKFYGAGHYPDSTQATGQTIIYGSFYFGGNADSALLEGFSIQGEITVDAGAEYVKIRRNILGGTLSFYGNYGQIDGNALKAISGPGPMIIFFSNNIIEGAIYAFGMGTLFRNNIFLGNTYTFGPAVTSYCVFENNIFLSPTSGWNYNNYSIHNTFTKNLFNFTPDFNGNTATDNYFNVSNIFITQSGSTFNYSHNYHLQNPGNYPGTDATQCGIYGGLFVYKEGAVPANPHIISKTISATTDGAGKLNATIKVAAQNN